MVVYARKNSDFTEDRVNVVCSKHNCGRKLVTASQSIWRKYIRI